MCIKWVKLVQWPSASYVAQLSTENVSFAQTFTLLIAAENTTDNKYKKASAPQMNAYFYPA